MAGYSFSIVLKERTWRRRRRVEKIRWKTYLLLNMMYSGQIYGFIFKAKLSKTVFMKHFGTKWDPTTPQVKMYGLSN